MGVFGPGGGPSVTIRLHTRIAPFRLMLNPELAAGEAYMDGTLTIEEGTLRDFLHICTHDPDAPHIHATPAALDWLARPFRYLQQHNTLRRAKSNVAHHYDLSGKLYELFLDEDRQYSCAYFPDGDENLEEAQEKKKRHIAAKLLLECNMKVLDIGSGWGGLALSLAQMTGADITGITLSEEQLKVARMRAEKTGLSDRTRFFLRDYRHEKAQYDRIVSVGMFEHVGAAHYGTYFKTLRNLLKPDGVALVHSIGRRGPPTGIHPWIGKYIFPGGYCPALSEVLAAVERSGLWVADIEVLRLHYAETLRHWHERFLINRDKVRALYDERFCRMWEFYLLSCEIGFRNLDMMVFQIQLTRNQNAAPLSRDYISQWEALFRDSQTQDRGEQHVQNHPFGNRRFGSRQEGREGRCRPRCDLRCLAYDHDGVADAAFRR
ncbi:MAG: class I SAM-dependent methyltransferase [Alphaproteobacteria bacterium]